MDQNPYRSPDVPPVAPLRRSWAWTALIALAGLLFAYTSLTVYAFIKVGTHAAGSQRAMRLSIVLAILSFLGLIGAIAFSRRSQKTKQP